LNDAERKSAGEPLTIDRRVYHELDCITSAAVTRTAGHGWIV